MADDKKKNLNAWVDQLDEADQGETKAETQGPAGELLRQAMAINPQLFKEKQESQLRKEIDAAKREAEEKKPLQQQTGSSGGDLTTAILEAEERYFTEKNRLRQEIARLQAEEREMPGKVLERIINAVLLLDPNMVSPKTLEILSMKKEFLSTIGFSPRKVIDKQIASRGRK